MTTLVALASKHALVMGTDSLGTVTRRFVNPENLFKFFDPEDDFKLKLGDHGQPVLTNIFQLVDESENIPYNQLLHVHKLFKLGNLPVAVAFTGSSSIGDHTVRVLISEFTGQDQAVTADGTANYTVKSISGRLLSFLRKYYRVAFPQEFLKQDLELLVGGYDRNKQYPTIVRVDVRKENVEVECAPGEFGIAFGGQMDWIQRIVFGTDHRNRIKLQTRAEELLQRYRQKVLERLDSQEGGVDIADPSEFGEEFHLFHEWEMDQLQANWAEFTEQSAIDCVDFFLNIMIRAQDVSAQLPTVGGNVHIAVIRKDGFHPVTKEVWRHGDHEVVIPGVGQ